MWVRFSFRSLLVPAYTSRYLQAHSGVVGGIYRDFNLLHRSLLKRFPLFVWLVCWSLHCLISALTQAGGGGLLFRLLVPSRCFPLYAAQAPGCSIWSGPCCAVPALGCSTKARNRKLRLLFASSRSEGLRKPGA